MAAYGPMRNGQPLTWSQVRAGVHQAMQLRSFRLAWMVYITASAADCLSTAVALASGRMRERNPLAAALFAHGGMLSLVLLKTAVLGILLCAVSMLPRRVAVGFSIFLAAGVLVVVADNVNAISRTLG